MSMFRAVFESSLIRHGAQCNKIHHQLKIEGADALSGKRGGGGGGPLIRLLVAPHRQQQQKRPFSDMPRPPPIVYWAAPSPPSRAVLLAAAAIHLHVQLQDIDLAAGQHLTQHFTKMNPEHTVPCLDDNGFTLWDSHAIMCYLVDKYAKNDSLYPKDICQRALVNQRLHFESGVLFARLRFISFPLFSGITKQVTLEKMHLLEEAYKHLNNFLEGKEWLVGQSYTLADISCATSISSIQCVHPIDKFTNVKAWLKRCEETLPRYEAINTPGCKIFHKLITNKIISKANL